VVSQPDAVTALLARIRDAVDYLADIETQDRAMVLEMSQAMLGDVIEGRGLRPMTEYIGRYCTLIDGPADVDRIAAGI
jgi:hypothetical protein